MILYKTVAKEAVCEQTIEKSRFITHVKPVTSKEEADQFIAEIRKEYKDATHNVPAMVLGDKAQVQWASDDGEPRGTSGAPMVQLLVNEEITNVLVVVTRYFGGIKLGTGGLVRAYTSSAKHGLEAAGIKEVQEIFVLKLSFDYKFYPQIERFIMSGNYELIESNFGEKVELQVGCPSENQEQMKADLANLTNGTYEALDEKTTIR